MIAPRHMRLFYWCCQLLCKWFCILYCRARVFGRRNVLREGGVLLVSNHQSYLDPVLAGMALEREVNFMARDSLFRNPAFGRLIAALNAFPVRRGEADLAAIKETLRRLRDGKIVLIFPEGTRSPDGRIGVMLPGLAGIARKAQVPIVPVLIDGMFQAWPRGQALPWPSQVIVQYGAPLLPEEYAGWPPDRLMGELCERLIAMQRCWHSRVPHRRLKWWNAG